MAQLAIYLEEGVARDLKKVSRKSGLSRSEWVSRVIRKELSGRIPEEFFNVLGTWEDDRPPEKIFRDLRRTTHQKARTPLL